MVTNFIALDVETANSDFASICSIGLVHFKAGEVFKSLTILIDPEDNFSSANIAIHGIRPEDVAGKPTMAKVFPIISSALLDTAIVHHSPFDRTALARAAARYGADGLPCIWLDTLQVARRAWDSYGGGNGGYGLKNLASSFGIEFRHHDAAEDARAAGLILLRAMADTKINLQAWIDDIGYESVAGYLPRPFKRKTDWKRHSQDGNPDGPLFGETVVFTGELSLARDQAAQMAANAGCKVADSVSRKITMLVVGDQDLRLTKGQEKSSKQRKAEAMIAEGAPIRMVCESDFMMMVGHE
ncbi:exonuclease domain-containing protein [Bradyrhizobium sp. S69]|uniref:exonuclease domain-containing protein n=1 Tax=Bradyrhizobium sp. S69 TaxID=1641856 RepID=UPI00131AB2F1|nr:exonuclease domain-containing protein [Bradyrhizobium sp. S69]